MFNYYTMTIKIYICDIKQITKLVIKYVNKNGLIQNMYDIGSLNIYINKYYKFKNEHSLIIKNNYVNFIKGIYKFDECIDDRIFSDVHKKINFSKYNSSIDVHFRPKLISILDNKKSNICVVLPENHLYDRISINVVSSNYEYPRNYNNYLSYKNNEKLYLTRITAVGEFYNDIINKNIYDTLLFLYFLNIAYHNIISDIDYIESSDFVRDQFILPVVYNSNYEPYFPDVNKVRQIKIKLPPNKLSLDLIKKNVINSIFSHTKNRIGKKIIKIIHILNKFYHYNLIIKILSYY